MAKTISRFTWPLTNIPHINQLKNDGEKKKMIKRKKIEKIKENIKARKWIREERRREIQTGYHLADTFQSLVEQSVLVVLGNELYRDYWQSYA